MNNLTRSHLVVCLVVMCLPAFAVAQPRAATKSTAAVTPKKEILTNATVIELAQLGLSEAIILEKIRQSETSFDTSINGLKQLKAAKVSDAVIAMMLNPSSKSAPPPTSVPSPAPSIVAPPAKTPQQEKMSAPSAFSSTASTTSANDNAANIVRNAEGKGPLEITIRGNLAQVKSILKQQVLKEENTALEKESDSQVVFRTRLKGMTDFTGMILMGGNKITNLFVFILNELQGSVVIIADGMSVSKNVFGNEKEMSRLINNKKVRPYITSILLQVKKQAESSN